MLIKTYTKDWIKNFEDLKIGLNKGLIGCTYQIEHIGSTAVPYLDSKPIIDIDIIYKTESEFEKIKDALVHLRYFHNGDQGIVNRQVFKRTSNQRKGILDTVKHHLYVCPVHSKALERHILFRNYLRKNDWARLAYQKMKYELAKKAEQNKKHYAELKELNVNMFIDSIIAQE